MLPPGRALVAAWGTRRFAGASATQVKRVGGRGGVGVRARTSELRR